MAFDSEADLRKVARPVLADKLGTDDTRIVPEFSYSAGRTDLVYTSVSDTYLRRRTEDIGIKVPITNKSYLKTFLQLHNRSQITKEYFFEIGASNERTKREALNWLKKSGFVIEEDGYLRTAPYLRRHITQSFAVELKLWKWRDALKQASRGKSFAEYRYVVLDADHINSPLDNRAVFREKGVGLVSIDEWGNYVEHISPEKIRPFSPLHSWILNERTLNDRSQMMNV